MGVELIKKNGSIKLTAPSGGTGGNVDLSNYYTKPEVDALIPSVEGLASEEYVQEQIGAIEIPEVDLSNYYNKDQVDAAIDTAVENIDIPEVDLSGYATKEEIPDVSGFLTDVPEEYITETELEGKGYLTEHQSLDGLVTSEWIESNVYEQWQVDTMLGEYAKTTDIPDVSAYQTEAQVIALIQANMPASGDEVSY